MPAATRGARAQPEIRSLVRDVREAEVRFDANAAAANKLGEKPAELATRSQLVIHAATGRLFGIMSTQEPHNLRVRLFVLELRQIKNGAHRGMPRAEHGHVLP